MGCQRSLGYGVKQTGVLSNGTWLAGWGIDLPWCILPQALVTRMAAMQGTTNHPPAPNIDRHGLQSHALRAHKSSPV